MTADATSNLLERHHQGDPEALPQLLALHLPTIRAFVHRRLPQTLRRDDDTMDIVQDVAAQVLKEGPRFRATDAAQFLKLVGTMVTNRLCDRLRTRGAQKRSPAMEAGSIDDTVLDLRPLDKRPGPATEAGKRELAAEIQLAMELLAAEEREIILWRDFEKQTHKEIGERLGITAAAAHMRCSAAHDRLADAVVKLRSGKLDELAGDDPQ